MDLRLRQWKLQKEMLMVVLLDPVQLQVLPLLLQLLGRTPRVVVVRVGTRM